MLRNDDRDAVPVPSLAEAVGVAFAPTRLDVGFESVAGQERVRLSLDLLRILAPTLQPPDHARILPMLDCAALTSAPSAMPCYLAGVDQTETTRLFRLVVEAAHGHRVAACRPSQRVGRAPFDAAEAPLELTDTWIDEPPARAALT